MVLRGRRWKDTGERGRAGDLSMDKLNGFALNKVAGRAISPGAADDNIRRAWSKGEKKDTAGPRIGWRKKRGTGLVRCRRPRQGTRGMRGTITCQSQGEPPSVPGCGKVM